VGRKALKPPPGGWERAISGAIQRIKNGEPTDTQLLKLAKLGSLHIGPSTVARESRCPRNYISHEGCRYPQLYQEIKALMNPIAEPHSLTEVTHTVQQRNKELLQSIKVTRSKIAAVLIWVEYEKVKEYDRKVDEINRVAKRLGADPNKVVGRSRYSVPVIEMPPTSPEERLCNVL
jgi:hypothetical protein